MFNALLRGAIAGAAGTTAPRRGHLHAAAKQVPPAGICAPKAVEKLAE